MTTEPISISFYVEGIPQPCGSKKALPIPNGRGGYVHTAKGVPMFNVMDDNPRADAWKSDVKWAAREAYQDLLLAGPLELVLAFFVPRPLAHYGTGRNARVLKPCAPDYPIPKPDATKLVRAVEDALTGCLWRDDAQIVDQHVTKRYGDRPGVQVTVRTIGPTQPPLIDQLKSAIAERLF